MLLLDICKGDDCLWQIDVRLEVAGCLTIDSMRGNNIFYQVSALLVKASTGMVSIWRAEKTKIP